MQFKSVTAVSDLAAEARLCASLVDGPLGVAIDELLGGAAAAKVFRVLAEDSEVVLLGNFRISIGLELQASLCVATSALIGPSGGVGGAGASEAVETALTVATSSPGSSLGRDRASATKLALPWTYLMSVVNSEMHDSW